MTAKCTIGRDGFNNKGRHVEKCENPPVPGSMLCEFHRTPVIEAIKQHPEPKPKRWTSAPWMANGGSRD